jgi:hypothetical protein
VTLPLHVREEAEVELRAARIWYDEKSPGLGKQFLSCVEAAFAVIGRHPIAFDKSSVKCDRLWCAGFRSSSSMSSSPMAST